MECIQCGEAHDKKGKYCSKRCTDKAYRERKKLRNELDRGELIDEKEENIDIPPETGDKLKWCNYCGLSIENSSKLGFCDEQHERDYWYAVHHNLTLKLKIDSKTIVETRGYHKVQDIVEAMANRKGYGVILF
jgi:hypothetical protein